MKKGLVNVQIGKRGVSKELIENLRNAFKQRENVRIRVLKSAGHDRTKVKEMAEEVVEELGKRYTYKIVGFTIFIKKWRKAKR